MSTPKIELYQIRDFGAKINATIEYIRFNFRSLIKIVLLIVVPLGLILGIIMSNFFTEIFSLSDPDFGDEFGLEILSFLGINYLLIALISMVVYAFMIGGIYTYMKLREEGGDISVSNVYGKVLGKVPGMVLLMILTGICSFVGFLFFIIPGVYLMITLTLTLPIYLFEEIDIGQAFGKSFKLIRDKWWSTFGLVIVTSIIAGVVSYVFAIPFYILMFGGMFTAIDEGANDPDAMMSIFSGWYASAGMAFLMIGSYITYMIPVIAIAFQYTNLVERQEGRGLRKEIDEFEKLD